MNSSIYKHTDFANFTIPGRAAGSILYRRTIGVGAVQALSLLLFVIVVAPRAQAQGGSIVEWGQDAGAEGQDLTPKPTTGTFSAVSTSQSYSVAIRSTDGTLVGWGNNYLGQKPFTPSGTFSAVSAGSGHVVGLRTDGTLYSWMPPVGCYGLGEGGYCPYPVLTDTPNGTFTAVAASNALWSVAIRTNGTLAAWGRDPIAAGQDPDVLHPPGGTFRAVAAGFYHGVAIRTDGSLVSWGDDAQREVTDTPKPTKGPFVAVAAGDSFSVAIDSKGKLLAWGANNFLSTEVNKDTRHYSAVAAGAENVVAISTDGTVVVFGTDTFGQKTNKPTGKLLTIAARFYHIAAIQAIPLGPISRTLNSLGPSRLWIGLKNANDQGTRFDLQTEIYKNNSVVASGLTRCISTVTSDPSEALVPWGPFSATTYNSGDVFSIKVSARIGTNSDGTQCFNKDNAPLRLYYDSVQRPSRFGAQLTPDPFKDFYLHPGSPDFFNDMVPTSSTARSKDSSNLKFPGGNSWVAIDTWKLDVVQGPVTTITTTGLADGTVGVPYSQTLAATGGTAPYSWSIVAGSPPPGLTLTGATISGTPTTANTFTFTIQAIDSGTPTAQTHQGTFTVTVFPPPLLITATSLAAGVVGAPYSQNLAATGGTPPYSWSIAQGVLPAGLTLNGVTISGTPSTAATYNFRVQVFDSRVPAYQNSRDLSITVFPPPLLITTASLTAGTVGAPYSQHLAATGGTPPYSWSFAQGGPPAGLTLNGATISGTPTTAGTSNFRVQVTDSRVPAYQTSGNLSITVNTELVITTTSLPAGEAGVAYSQSLAATGGTPPYNWSIVSGSLPDNLTLTGEIISRPPTTAATFNFTVQVTDNSVPVLHTNQALSIRVNPAATLITCLASEYVRTGAGYTITSLGQYRLAEDCLVPSGDVLGINIQASDVDLDLNGHTISGPNEGCAGRGIGIVVGGSRTNVHNGTLTRLTEGLRVFGNGTHADSRDNKANNLISTGNCYGILLFRTDHNDVRDNNLSGNIATGMIFTDSHDNTFTSNSVNNTGSFGGGGAVYVDNSNRNVITSNTISGNATYGMRVGRAHDNTIASNTINGNVEGLRVENDGDTHGNIIQGNTASGNRPDLEDGNPGCVNTWTNNIFATDNELAPFSGPNAGCIQ